MRAALHRAFLALALAALAALAACGAPRETVAPAPADAPPAAATADSPESHPRSADAANAVAAEPPPPAAARKAEAGAAKGSSGEVDYSCRVDADCTVKNVGNCCGYYPACVNASSPTFPEQVKAACAASGTSGICGFPAISGCQCVQWRCEARRDRCPREGAPRQ